jgi:putative transposase
MERNKMKVKMSSNRTNAFLIRRLSGIVQLAVDQNVGTIIIGQNRGWKQYSDMGKRNNQAFCHIPHHLLISMIRYKAAEQSIDVQLTEEAYTSQSSFLDHDPLPR